ncbi:MAG TPA: amidase [Hyphomicrobiaceae bacterium]|nr:amidase [Hyphomicrobiaceae bacterium]
MPNLIDLKRQLAAGRTTSRALVEASLSAIADAAGEGARCFLSVYEQTALAEAERVDAARGANLALPPFAGIPISIKDLFDVAGEVTRAGSHVLDTEPPAARDADIVALLRRAGFVIVGKTNMTEFAYSGLGMNAHYGTPRSPFDRSAGRIPGGSTSGGAVSVADGMTVATIGTDTGGSCRIPAAFCGIVGFKPTSTRVSKRGAIPLSQTLDSVGPLARTVSCCAVLDSILSGGDGEDEESYPVSNLCLGVIEGYVDEKLDEAVAAAYQAALSRLSQKGVRLKPLGIPELSELPHINRNGGLVGAEAYAWHRRFLETRSEFYDPWVRARFDAGRAQSAADYVDTLNHRARVIEAVRARSRFFDALVLPAVQIVPPTIDSLQELAASNRINNLCLRNTSIANFLDRPSITIPCHAPGTAPVGLMLMGETGQDRRLLSIARGLEYTVRL